jgi:hypothetical protein
MLDESGSEQEGIQISGIRFIPHHIRATSSKGYNPAQQYKKSPLNVLRLQTVVTKRAAPTK